MRAVHVLILLSLGSSGCVVSCGPTGPRSPEYCDRFASGMDWSTAVPTEVAAGDGKGDEFVAYVPGGDATLVAGGQGAYMITPVLRVAADGPGEVACWEASITNTIPEYGFMPEIDDAYVFDRVGDYFYSDPLFNQLVDTRAEVEGKTVTMEITLTAGSTMVTQTIDVVPR